MTLTEAGSANPSLLIGSDIADPSQRLAAASIVPLPRETGGVGSENLVHLQTGKQRTQSWTSSFDES